MTICEKVSPKRKENNMPYGKGTYGSKKGRPTVKKKTTKKKY